MYPLLVGGSCWFYWFSAASGRGKLHVQAIHQRLTKLLYLSIHQPGCKLVNNIVGTGRFVGMTFRGGYRMRWNVEKAGDSIDFVADPMRWQYQQLIGRNGVDNRPVKITPVTEIGFNRIQAFEFEHFFAGLVFELFGIKKELVPSSHRHVPGNREI